MNKKRLKLAAEFLKQYSEQLSNAGCNEWDFPDDWTLEERQEFSRMYAEFNASPEEYDPDHPRLMDFQAVNLLVDLIEQETP